MTAPTIPPPTPTDRSDPARRTGTVTRRRLMQASGGLVIGFSLTGAFRRAGILAQEPRRYPGRDPGSRPRHRCHTGRPDAGEYRHP